MGMIKEVKTIMVLDQKAPSFSDIEEAKSIAMKNHCLVRIEWCIPFSGNYSRMVSEYSDLEEIYNSLPKVYGV